MYAFFSSKLYDIMMMIRQMQDMLHTPSLDIENVNKICERRVGCMMPTKGVVGETTEG